MSSTTEYFVHYTNDNGNREYIGCYSTKEKAKKAVDSLYDKGYTDAESEGFIVELE
ncbi:MAG: hypothetical protein V7731_21110 [Amphritea sp.]